jgi:phasin family protein
MANINQAKKDETELTGEEALQQTAEGMAESARLAMEEGRDFIRQAIAEVTRQAMAETEQAKTEFGSADFLAPAVPYLETFIAATWRNMGAFTAANRVALEGARAVTHLQMEIMQQAMSGMTEAMRALSDAESPQERVALQADLLKQSYERAAKNVRELSNIIQGANRETIDLLNRRFAETMDEIKALSASASPLPGDQTTVKRPPKPSDEKR